MKSYLTEKIVLKLSGSTFFSDSFTSISKEISKVVSSNAEILLVIVAGGGANARSYIKLGADLGLDHASLDEIGIAITRLNAQAFIDSLGRLTAPQVPESLSELMDLLNLYSVSRKQRIYVCGGFHPGQSTNAVGALIAEKLGARFVNATDVEGVHERDPKVYKDSRLLKSVTPRVLSRILEEGSMAAGGYDLMDPVALGIISRSRIPTQIVLCQADVLSDVLTGRGQHGTSISFE